MENVKPDMLFMLHGFTIHEHVLKNLKERFKFVSVDWLCDYPKEYELACKYAHLFDHFFVSGTDALKRLRLSGHKNVNLLMFACEPRYHKPVELSPEEREKYASDICFIGSGTIEVYKKRRIILEKLVDFDLGIWGPGWDRTSKESPLNKFVRDSHTKPIE